MRVEGQSESYTFSVKTTRGYYYVKAQHTPNSHNLLIHGSQKSSDTVKALLNNSDCVIFNIVLLTLNTFLNISSFLILHDLCSFSHVTLFPCESLFHENQNVEPSDFVIGEKFVSIYEYRGVKACEIDVGTFDMNRIVNLNYV